MSTVRTMKTMSAWRRAQHGWPASFPLVQFPNVPLFVAIGGAVASRLTDGTAHDYARAVFYVGLTAWAYEELVDGTNWYRRILGAAGLVYVIVKLAAAFGA